LEAFFGSLENAWNATIPELKAAGIEDRPAEEIVAARNNSSPDEEMDALARAEVSVASWNNDLYPARLKQIPDPPPVIYYKGTLLLSDERAVAVVGTRNPTSYGREAAAVLSRDLAGNSITVVSGLARGIDGIAHRTVLETGGRTFAVLAGGLDSVYSKEHAGLFQQIQSQGAVICEQSLGVKPDARSFPRRNRVTSGMTLGTVVVEAAEGSGARWTVYQALEQNREVFCVPGSIFSPASRFTNRMIQEGAKLVSTCTDILEELNISSINGVDFSEVKQQGEFALGTGELWQDGGELWQGDGSEEAVLLGHIDQHPVHIDEIGRRAGLAITSVNSMLTLLELKGMVKQVGCMHYVRSGAVGAVNGN
jgi:DNA processing protein